MSEDTNRREIHLGEKLRRSFSLDRKAFDPENRTATLSFASEEPVERYYRGEIINEVLDIEHLDLSRLSGSGSGALLLNHDPDQQPGGVTKAWVDSDGVARANVKFSRSQLGTDVMNDVEDEIRGSTSFAYSLNKEIGRSESDDGVITVRFSSEALEVSIVGVPADATVGVGRSKEDHQKPKPKKKIMSEETKPIPATEPARVQVINEPTDDQRRSIADKALHDERKRTSEIDAATERLSAYQGVVAIAQEAKREGLSVADFNARALEAISAGKLETRDFGLTKKEKRNYMMTDGIRAAAQGHAIDGIVGEVSREMSKRSGKEPPSNGFWVPMELGLGRSSRKQHVRTDLTTVDTTFGDDLYPDVHRGDLFIERLRPQLLMEAMGARIINVNSAGALSIPRMDGNTSLTWQTEASGSTESNPTGSTINLSPYEGSTYTDMSWRLVEHSDPGIEGLVRQDLNETIAQGLDGKFIAGTGTNQPEGVEVGCTGIFSTADNDSPTRAECLAAEADVATANSLFGDSLYWLTTPAIRQNMKNTQEDSGSGQFLCSNDNTVLGYPLAVSTLVTASKIVFGRMDDYLGVVFGGVMILTDQYSQAASRLLRVHACVMADGEVRHGASFSENA